MGVNFPSLERDTACRRSCLDCLYSSIYIRVEVACRCHSPGDMRGVKERRLSIDLCEGIPASSRVYFLSLSLCADVCPVYVHIFAPTCGWSFRSFAVY